MADGELMRQHYAAASAEEQGKLWTLSSTMSGGGNDGSYPKDVAHPYELLTVPHGETTYPIRILQICMQFSYKRQHCR
jgi:hypothetical protein